MNITNLMAKVAGRQNDAAWSILHLVQADLDNKPHYAFTFATETMEAIKQAQSSGPTWTWVVGVPD